MWVNISEKKKSINFSSLRSPYNKLANRKILWKTWSLAIFQSGWNNGIKLWVFNEYPGTFPDNVTPDIWLCRWSSSSVWCSRCKNTFLSTGNIQMIVNKFWCESLWVVYVLFLDPVLYIVLVYLESESYNLRSWLHEN